MKRIPVLLAALETVASTAGTAPINSTIRVIVPHSPEAARNGADRKSVPAKTVIERASLLVSHTAVPKPVAACFGCSEIAQPNLIHQEDLPAPSAPMLGR